MEAQVTDETIIGIQVRGLTLTRPWSAAFDCGKNVENRPKRLLKLPLWLALHSGKGWSQDAWDGLTGGAYGQQAWEFFSRLKSDPSGTADFPDSVITHLVLCDECIDYRFSSYLESNPWAFGPYCWSAKHVIPLQPVPCTGKQGLWRLPPDVFAAVADQVSHLRSLYPRQA